VPAVVGVPDRTPVSEFKVSPSGSVSPVLTASEAPLAPKVVVYDDPAAAFDGVRPENTGATHVRQPGFWVQGMEANELAAMLLTLAGIVTEL